MQPNQAWNQDTLFVEIGVRDCDFVRWLANQGFEKYLGVSASQQQIERLQAEQPKFANRLTHSRERRLVLHNNADVLILSGLRAIFTWKFRSTRHAHWVAWPLGLNPIWLVAWLGCLFHMTRRRYSLPQLVKCRLPDGRTRRLFVSRILRHKFCSRLHFVPHVLGLRGMFQKLDAASVQYAVLRWFESLPKIEPSEDLDILIADDSLDDALAIMHSYPGIQPIDAYSETGLPRSAYCGMAYYPPRVARRILEGAVRHNNLCSVPSRSDYFHSLAYHAVYHKGVRSGLPHKTGLHSRRKVEHDYTSILRTMAAELGIDVEISLESLHAYLQATAWGPTPDMLARLAAACPRNKWLQYLNRQLTPEVDDAGLAVFVLRQEAIRRGFQTRMVELIEQAGFEIIAVKVIEPHQVEDAAARCRGGNWGNGPYSVAGGPPAVAVVAYDPHPIPLTRQQRRKFPQRTNARLFVKDKIRDAVNEGYAPEKHCNAVHSSDFGAEAHHLVEVFAPELLEEIDDRLAQVRGYSPQHAQLQRAA